MTDALGRTLAGPLAKFRRQFDPAKIFQQALVLAALFFLNKAGTAGAIAFFVIVFYMACTSPVGAFKALAIVGLGVQLNQFFVPKSIVWTPTRIALTAFCAARCASDVSAVRPSLRIPSYIWALTLFCATSAVCSILSGYYTQIALLKLLNFWTGASAILLVTEVLRRRQIDMTPWFVALCWTIVLFGLAAIAMGQAYNYQFYRGVTLAQARNSLFNGAFLHPNSHSSFCGPAVVFLGAAALFGRYRNRWLPMLAAAILLFFMVKSQSRSSLLSAAGGLLVLAAYATPVKRAGSWLLRANVSRSALIAMSIAVAGGIAMADMAMGGRVARQVIAFINKSQAGEEIKTEDVMKSRQGKIQESWRNFLKSPIYGIGFQVAKTEFFRENASLFTAPAEKGFLPTAVLEEGGVLGATTFVAFLLTLVAALLRQRNVAGLAVFTSVMISSTPEVAIFAMGGSGTYMWAILGAGILLGDRCWQNTQVPVGPRATAFPARINDWQMT